LKIWKARTRRSMTLYKRKSNVLEDLWKVRLRNDPYLFINIIFAGVIILIFLYSLIFSPSEDKYPVVCLHQQLTGEPCISCGLSHSFSLIVRGRINEAYQWNIYGMRVFIFFASQLVLRIFFSGMYLRNIQIQKQLIIMDSVGSGLIFIIAFWPYISNIVSGIFT